MVAAALATALTAAQVAAGAPAAAAPAPQRVSVNADGRQANGHSDDAVIARYERDVFVAGVPS